MNNNPVSQANKQTSQPSYKRVASIVLCCIVGGFILLDLSPVGGNYRMYGAWIQCGQKPVAAYNFMAGMFYEEPSLYSFIDIIQPTHYFCSPVEAEAAGYEPSLSYKLNHPLSTSE